MTGSLNEEGPPVPLQDALSALSADVRRWNYPAPGNLSKGLPDLGKSMYILALATDYDETLAEVGIVSDDTYAALERLAKTGRKLILVTGRELDDLQQVFPRLDIFDKVVAENGALLYTPASKAERVLAHAPSVKLVERLRALGVKPLSIGRSIVATREPNEQVALQVIKELGLELEIIFNKGAVMILPSGVNKATGLACGSRGTGAFAAQCRWSRRCSERPYVFAHGRLRGGRCQCAAGGQGYGGLCDPGIPRGRSC